VVVLPAVGVGSGSSAYPQTFLLLDTAKVAEVVVDPPKLRVPSAEGVALNKGLL
jgi:hypothetical protein